MLFKRLLLPPLLLLMSACSQVQIEQHTDLQPAMQLEQFFSGQMTAHGVVKDRSGKIIRTFNADIAASWDAGVGTLDEDFIFDDGELQKRIWTLTPQADGSYTGSAGDVVGDGQLMVAGNSVFLDYVLRIPYKDGTIDVRVDDRMYLVTDDILLNESRMLKFGVQVGSLLLVIIRQPAEATEGLTP
ncbi:DUF3833 domain-containing protein [Halieaceae bacterium IMCC14734]|uniref:DUF3833 domain-containing protein n=1 Tax=Candidatus Litorirhabdus singularis TaxID=2518993 RepID=A0ABT3TBQ9_9GAMM|nr:DUF3833 domain-containing protein [Candidatus Litorirhabdus singularis]MCX2979635.1 DUF3833 domain-containing protein [Candidatus Litorirhabdus singularis]